MSQDLTQLVRAYFQAKEAKEELDPGRMLQLKGAARQASRKVRVAALREAEDKLRRAVGMHQHLLFINFHDKKPGMPNRLAIPVAVPWQERQIANVWTLYHHTDPNVPPALPYQPRHHVNAFHEDYVHDWNIDHHGRFRYASRVTDEPVWVLVELK